MEFLLQNISLEGDVIIDEYEDKPDLVLDISESVNWIKESRIKFNNPQFKNPKYRGKLYFTTIVCFSN